MTDRLITSNRPPDNASVPARRPDPVRPVKANSVSSRDLARSISTTMRNRKAEERMKTSIDTLGYVPEWTHDERGRYVEARRKEENARAVGETINRANNLGVSPVDELTGGGVGIYDQEGRIRDVNIEAMEASPEGEGFIREVQQDAPTKIKDLDDLYQRYRYSPAMAVKALRKEQLDIIDEGNKILEEQSGENFGSNTEFWGGMATLMLPLYEAAGLLSNKIALGNDGGAFRILPGQIREDFRNKFESLSQEERRVWLKETSEAIWASPWRSDLLNQSFIQDVVSSDVLLRDISEQDGWDILDNVIFAMEALTAGAAAAAMFPLKGGMRIMPPTMRALRTVNKDVAASDMAQMLAELDDATMLREYNISRTTVARTQLPSPGGLDDIVEEVPDGVLEEVDRITALQSEAMGLAARQRTNIYDNTDVVSATEKQAQIIEETWGGQARPSMSRIQLFEDGTGIRFNTMIGKNEKNGFKSERTAFEQAEELIQQGKQVRIYTSNGTKLEPYLTQAEAMEGLAAIRSGSVSSKRGTFFVEFEQDYFMRPTDRGLFGDDVMVSPEWLGRAGRYVLSPSAQFSPKFFEPYLANFLGSRAMVGTLQAITAPIFKMSRPTRRNIDNMYAYTEEFARTQGRAPTMQDYKAAFPDAGSDEYRGLYIMKRYYDTLYDLQNDRLYRDWKSQGFISVRSTTGNGSYHGKPVDRLALGPEYDGSKNLHVYNPSTNSVIKLTSNEVSDLYERGGSVLRSDLDITVKEDTLSNLILNDPSITDWRAGELSQYPLRYIEGYWPRIYEDYYVIEKTVPSASKNGKIVEGGHTQVMAVASTKADAEKFVRRMTEKSSSGAEYSFRDVARMSDKDRTAMDRQRMQLEGRLFFDDRNQRQLYNVNGSKADIISPTNMLQRSSLMVANQVGTDELIGAMKSSWDKSFGHLVGDIDRVHTSAITAELKKIVQTGGKEEKALANKALATWDYIRVMEGSINEGSKWFRQNAINAAEWLHENLSGVPGASRATEYLTRNIHKASPVENLKHLAFLDFIVTRPVRQIVLQGSQHLFLQALDPTYVGKWQTDSALLLQGMKSRSARLMGASEKELNKRNAQLMGLSREEYALLVKEFDKSGLTQTVNIHSFAGDMPKVLDTPADRLGDAAQTAGRTLTAAPIRENLQQLGFDLGEQYNVTASYLMALRLYNKEKGFTKLTQLKDADWQAVAAKGSNLGLAMNRANSSKYQYGIFSLPMQFLQFTHKTFLTMLRGVPGVSSLGNKAFTPAEARKLIAGQMILFGGAGFGIKPEVERLFAEYGIPPDSKMVDIVAGGVLDYAIDKSLQLVLQDDELNLAVDEFLAPGANLINVGRDFFEIATETPLIEALGGPSGATLGRMWDSYKLGRVIVADSDLTAVEKSAAVGEAVLTGMASGYNDFVKARIAANHGRFMANNGQLVGTEATWAEIVAKGMLGLNSEQANDAYRVGQEVADINKELKDATREYHSNIHKYIKMFHSGENDREQTIRLIAQEKAMLQMAFTEQEWAYVVEEFNRIEKNYDESRDNVGTLVANAIFRGLPVDEYIVMKAQEQGLSEQDQEALHLMWEEQTREATLSAEAILEGLDADIQLLEERNNGN